jgi:putative ubiquitin-RnfH superfamily antitoxin RatB of RatAB toxin-antitoxin module
MIAVEVIYSPGPRQVEVVPLALPEGSTVAQALAASGLLERHGLAGGPLPDCGVWGRRQPPAAVLRDRDRVEVYRPLRCDPKEARRQRYRQRPASGRAARATAPGAA